MLRQLLKKEDIKNQRLLCNNDRNMHSKILIIVENDKDIPFYRNILKNFELSFCNINCINSCHKILSLKATDLCILCCNKKIKSFYKLIKFIREIDCQKTTKLSVILVSANNKPNHFIHAYKQGVDLYIAKPFNNNIFIATVTHIMNLKISYHKDLESKENFLAMVTHDLKTPVNASISAFNLLLSNQIESETDKKEIMLQIYAAVKYSKNMIDNILSKSKLEKNRLEIYRTPFCLKLHVEDCIRQLDFLSNEKYQKFVVHSNIENVPVFADEIEIKRVLTNLINNAIEYAPQHSVIDISINQNKEFTNFSITNSGPGIALQNPNDIFEKYISYAKKYKRIGSGLGLYIAKQIITAHGGTIKAESQLNAYTTLSFSLPNEVEQN